MASRTSRLANPRAQFRDGISRSFAKSQQTKSENRLKSSSERTVYIVALSCCFVLIAFLIGRTEDSTTSAALSTVRSFAVSKLLRGVSQADLVNPGSLGYYGDAAKLPNSNGVIETLRLGTLGDPPYNPSLSSVTVFGLYGDGRTFIDSDGTPSYEVDADVQMCSGRTGFPWSTVRGQTVQLSNIAEFFASDFILADSETEDGSEYLLQNNVNGQPASVHPERPFFDAPSLKPFQCFRGALVYGVPLANFQNLPGASIEESLRFRLQMLFSPDGNSAINPGFNYFLGWEPKGRDQ